MQRLPSTESQNAQAKTQEVRLLGPPKNGSVVMISQLPCTSALLSIIYSEMQPSVFWTLRFSKCRDSILKM